MANLMDLVRELKLLNARKKAGESLSDVENTRRKELKKYLKTALANQSGTGTPVNTARTATPAAQAAPQPVRTATPPAVQAQSPTPTPTAVRAAAVAPRTVTPAARAAAVAPRTITPAAAHAPNAFAIDASDLLAEAASSAAVATSASTPAYPDSEPSGPVPIHQIEGLEEANPLDSPQKAPLADLEVAAARGGKAARANRPKIDAHTMNDVEQEWGTIQEGNGYTPPELLLNHENYFLEYVNEGLTPVSIADSDLEPIDPREIELHRADLAGGASQSLPRGLVFLDDFVELYSAGGLSGPDDEVEPDIDDPDLIIPGKRKVTVHLLVGGVKRGTVSSFRRGELGFRIDPVGNGASEELSIGQIKAMFVHKSKGRAPVATGREITVTFQDGKAVKGASEDYAPGIPVFGLVPPPGRGQFEIIIINGAAVSRVA